MDDYILGIESSCDDTSAAVIKNTEILSNVIASQKVHAEYGGVIPELASRAHQQNIIPVVDTALKYAKITKKDLTAIAYTRGPGLLGSLLVGTSFAKALAYSLEIPLIEVDHIHSHTMALFLDKPNEFKSHPKFPFLCLTVSGGHTQIVLVKDYFTMEIIGKTIDDAAGETFDKAAKMLGFPYPGGPNIDNYAREGQPVYTFSKAHIPDFNFSFSGLKTSILYFLRDELKKDSKFIEKHKQDIAASVQKAIIDALLKKLILAAKRYEIHEIGVAGGVSANSGLRSRLKQVAEEEKWNLYMPDKDLTTDNAAMIAIMGYFKLQQHDFGQLDAVPYTRQEKSN